MYPVGYRRSRCKSVENDEKVLYDKDIESVCIFQKTSFFLWTEGMIEIGTGIGTVKA